MSSTRAQATVEHVARASYGRLVSLLAARTGDLVLAEDCLAAAFERALTTWPGRGVPDNPEGWLLTVARNRQRDTWKSVAHRTWVPLQSATGQGATVFPLDELDPDAIGDKRLELLFVCAHPDIDPAVRTPLMLQTVLGFDAARIATAFALAPGTMAQRLVRAKKRIKDARIPFAVPDRRTMPERLPAVLEAVYGCFAMAWPGDTPASQSLADEARHLAVTLAAALRTEPEAWGLAALVTLSLSRAPARAAAQFVPLHEQDPTTWDADLMGEGEDYLRRASRSVTPGRFQLEAAISAVHCDRARTHRTDWAALRTLYCALLTVAPSLGAHVALATVVGRLETPEAGLAALDLLTADPGPQAAGVTERFQPLHAVRADLLARAGRCAEAAAAFTTAASLSDQPTVRAYLEHRATTSWKQPTSNGPSVWRPT